MRLRATNIYADAWGLWRADWRILTAVAGMFVMLPLLAIKLLLEPDLDRARRKVDPGEVKAAWDVLVQWSAANLHWLLITQVLAQFAAAAIFVFYCDRRRPTVRAALRSGAGWLPFYLLVVILTAAFSTLGFFVFVIGYFYCLGRLSAAGPAMIAENNTNPLAALGRSLVLTRGHGLILMLVTAVIFFGAYLAQQPFDALDAWLISEGPNPVARLIVDIFSTALATLGLIATVLVQVAVYRRLAVR